MGNDQIDMMIDVISSDMPEFLDTVKSEDRDIFNYVSNMILMSKILATTDILNEVDIKNFTSSFMNNFEMMMDCSDNMIKLNTSYDYVSDFYVNFISYLITAEEFEMCANINNFMNCFNEYNDNCES